MARISGHNCVISINGQLLTGKSNEVTLDIEAKDVEEVNAFGEDWEYLVGGDVSGWSLSISGVYDGAASDIDSDLFAMMGAGCVSLDYLRPGGSGNGLPEYSADNPSGLQGVYLESYSVPIPHTGAVKWSASFRGSGELERSTQT